MNKKVDTDLAKLFLAIEDWNTIGTDTQYRIIEEPRETIIIFSQSNSKADWKINFSFPKKPYKRMPVPFYVHGGFLKEWKKINDYFLKRAARINKPITVVGWSYGGAMATLCYEDLWFNYPFKRIDMRLVTFGSPRVVGALHFKFVAQRWLGAKLYANGPDLVTRLPPTLFGFRHVTKLKHIGDKRTLLGIFKARRNHLIDAYIKHIENKKYIS